MRLIDADAIEWNEHLVPCGNGKQEYIRIAYMDDIDDLPTIKPEHKKGMWVKTGQSFINPNKFRNYFCSECGYEIEKIKYNFCPNCGEDMRGEQDELEL